MREITAIIRCDWKGSAYEAKGAVLQLGDRERGSRSMALLPNK
jgi:hypothetical protein